MKAPEAGPRETPVAVATAAANESESHETANHDSETPTIQCASALSDVPPDHPALPSTAADPIDVVLVKSEHGVVDDATRTRTSPTLRPAPQPSKKRRESEAALHTPESELKPNKKRKRGASPPWHFPTAETTTLKTADGRRISARVNVGTPGLSESEDKDRSRGRSASLSQSVTTNRSRPPSPPWRKFEAEGPTSIQVDGKRKSGRVNKELTDAPKRVSPRSKKQVDKLGAEKKHADVKPAASKSMGGSSRKSDTQAEKQINGHLERHSTNTASAAKIAELQAKIAALQPTRSFPSPVKKEEPVVNGSKSNTEKKDASKRRLPSPPRQRKAPRPSDAGFSPERMAKPSPRLRLKVGPRRIIAAPHPGADPPSPVLPPKLSVWQRIEELDIQELQAPYVERDQAIPSAETFLDDLEKAAAKESALRQRLLKEAQPGGILSKDQLSIYQDDQQPEPPQQYGHHDHLVAHALYLRQLQIREKTQHRALAKKIAYEALDKWRMMHGPTAEDLIAERNKNIDLIKKQIVADMKAKWEMVEAHVQELKKRAWEAEQERLRGEKLQQKLEFSQNLLAKQRGEADSDDDGLDADSESHEEESADDEDDDSEANMSDTESERAEDADEEQDEEGEMDDDALKAYLAQRQAEPPDKLAEVGEEEDIAMEEALGATPELDTADDKHAKSADEEGSVDEAGVERRATRGQEPDILDNENEAEDHLSTDESTDMDSEDYDSDEDMSSTGDELGGDDNDDEAENDDNVSAGYSLKSSLLGFYSTKELLEEKNGGLPTPMTSVENGGDNDNPRSQSEARSDSQADAGAQAAMERGDLRNGHVESIKQEFTTEISEERDEMDVDGEADQCSPDAEESAVSKALVPSPTLLRGTLRSYQHAGLDWLASLYRNGTNGILADEMGLGKTIQTISLLAHLAEVHEVWETHLVIVPTSVILNWVSEFQKFLPGFRVLGYYGTAEERAFKRKGWTNDPHNEDKTKRGYNVVITSYNVAKQDINAIRGQQWHYLILDEAHNIRNFNSQGWQLLIRLRTRARLLLTGTPLQNDLAEVWSLLTFLTAGDEDKTHGELEEFLSHWKDPVKEIFDQGVQKISENAQRVVEQLHISLRPFLLRRKKIEVEKDLPKKTESVVVCKLSKRQRQLYQDYMGLAETKATLAKGSGVQAGAVLLSLRRVCNHPDLFDPRPIQTSFAMEHSPLERYSVIDALVRRLLGSTHMVPNKLLVAKNSRMTKSKVYRSRSLAATTELQSQLDSMTASTANCHPDPATIAGTRALQRVRQRQKRLDQLRASIEVTRSALEDEPFVPADLRELVTVHRDRTYVFATKEQPTAKSLRAWLPVGKRAMTFEHAVDWHVAQSTRVQQDVATPGRYAARMQDLIVRFACVPPAATVPILDYSIPRQVQEAIRSSPAYPAENDFCHEARIRSSIAFPDKRLLIYDSGKLQRLTYLLRDLQSRGSRSLIFTQMTGTLNILEQFLNLLNLPYLRLDGSTPVERRQLYSAEFNRPDSKYQCMILSSRAGGVGLNLTGASSVIFFDLDWNPQMDRQCMDRAHRIGQTRDVEVYKMVSEKTVEENILRRANQKSLLDETVIQGGHFTTEYQHKRVHEESHDDEDDVAAAVERFLGQDEKSATKALASVEDKEDVQAAQQAGKEDRQDDVDFAERSSKGPSKANTPGPGAVDTEEDDLEDERKGHVDLYMIKHMQHLLKDWVYVPPPVRKLDKHGRDPSHRPKKRR